MTVLSLFLFLFQINLKLILVSGKTKEFLFSPSESAGDIAQHVFDNWPEGMVKTLTCYCYDRHTFQWFHCFYVLTFSIYFATEVC